MVSDVEGTFFTQYMPMSVKSSFAKHASNQGGTILKHVKCLYCHQYFTEECFLIQHEKYHCFQNPQSVMFGKKQSYVCNVCNAKYSYKQNLTYHQRHDCGKIHKCNNCQLVFKRTTSLRSHLKNCIEHYNY